MVAGPKIYGLFSPPKFEKGRPPLWKARAAKRAEEANISENHLFAITKLVCTLCQERRGVRAHSLVGGPAAAPGQRAPGWAIPLCMGCRAHASGIGPKSEERYFLARGINPYQLARGLREKYGNVERMALVVLRYKMQAEGVLQQDRQRGRS